MKTLLNLDDHLSSPDYRSGKQPEITSRIAAKFIGWQLDNAIFDRDLEKVIGFLRSDDGDREIPPKAKL